MPSQEQAVSSLSDLFRSSSEARDRFETVFWLVLGAVPLAVAPGAFVAYDLTPKLLILGSAACLSLAWISDWYPGLAMIVRSDLGRMYLGAVALETVSLIASSLSSTHPGLSLAGTTWRRYGLATQLMILLISVACAGYLAQRPTRIWKALVPLLIAGTIVGLFGMAQYFGYDFVFDPKLYSTEYLHLIRPPATLGHAMYFSAFLLPVVFVAGAEWLESDKVLVQAVLLMVVLASIIGIVMSGTRASVLGLICGGFVFVFRGRVRFGRRQVLLASVGAVIVALGFIALSKSSQGEAIRGGFERWKVDALGGPRLLTWRESLGMLYRNPILGAGPETFAQQFREVESAALARAYPEHYLESPHNLLLETGLAQGAIGLLGLFLLICASILSGLSTDAAAFASLSTGLLSALVATIVALQFMPLSVANALCFYSTCAMLVSLSANPSGILPDPQRWQRTLAILAIPVVSVVTLLFGVQDWAFARAGDAVQREDLARAEAYRWLYRLSFPQPGQDLWLSRQFATAAASNREQAPRALSLGAEASHRAELSSEDPFNAYYQSGALALAAGDPILGEEKLRTALRLAPTWYKPHMLLAESLLIRGCTEQGTTHARQAADLAGARRKEIERAIADLETAITKSPPVRSSKACD